MDKSLEERTLQWNMVSSFIEKYNLPLNEFEIMRIKSMLLTGSFPEVYCYDLIREICDELGFIPDEDNMYLAFLKELIENFDIKNSHIIEVGGGMIPCLGKKVSLLQTGGSLTIYDPRLLDTYEDGKNYKLIREEFTYNSKLGKTNLLIGLMPCKGAEILVDQAIKNKIDFMVWLCEGGPHGDYFDFYEDEEEWLCSIISSARRGTKENNMGPLQKKYLRKYSKDYPIIFSKKIN